MFVRLSLLSIFASRLHETSIATSVSTNVLTTIMHVMERLSSPHEKLVDTFGDVTKMREAVLFQ